MRTNLEKNTHMLITKKLLEEGHKTYSQYFQLFELHFIPRENKQSVAYMVPDKGIIYLNEGITSWPLVSLLIRHEMMHEYLQHGKRLQDYLKSKNLQSNPQMQKIGNLAADWELSKFYSRPIDKNDTTSIDNDYYNAKNLYFGTGKLDPEYEEIGKGLVMELDQEDWFNKNLSFEQMIDELLKDIDSIEDKIKDSSMINDMSEEQQQAAESYHDSQVLKDKAKELRKEAKKKRSENQQNKDNNTENNQEDSSTDDSDTSDNKITSSSSADLENEAEELENKAKELEELADKVRQGIEKMPPSFTEAGKKAEENIDDKLQKIKDFWDDINRDNAKKDDRNIELDRIYKNQQSKIIRNKRLSTKMNNSLSLKPFSSFNLDIQRAIKSQAVDLEKEWQTYTKVNRRMMPLTRVTGVVRPSTIKELPKKKPIKLNVYIDYSGSWSPVEKRQAGDSALKELESKYCKGPHPKLIIDKYYVTDEVYPFSEGPKGAYGANGEAIVKHIMDTKPDNVLILTDSDADYVSSNVTIKGCAWFLFYDTYAPSLYKAIRALKGSYVYDIHDHSLDKITK